MKKIVHLVNSKIYSGLERVAIEIIESLKDKYDFYYACQDGVIEDILKQKNIKRIKINGINRKEILKLEEEYKPDLIHAHDYKATLFCGIYIKNTNIISHLHNNPPWLKKKIHPYNYLLLKALKSPCVKKIDIVSESIKNEYIYSSKISNKMEIILNPVSCKKIQENIDLNQIKSYDICFVGRLTKQKNPLRFISIIYELSKKYPDIKVVMLGDGELKEQCKNKIKKLSLEKNIIMKGFVENPYKEMIKSKIFCLTSDWEGYGLVVFEALSLGLPVVTTNVGGISSIINEKCGFFCRENEEFINKISTLLENDNYIRYNHEAIKHAKEIENYDLYMKKILEQYKKYIN